MSVEATNLYNSLIADGFVGGKGIINVEFTLAGKTKVSHRIARPSSVGEIIEEWLRAYMTNKGIYFEAQSREDFPDYYLKKGDKQHALLEVKAYAKSAAFDIANVSAFCRNLPDHPYKLDADYLIINYGMSKSGDIIIKHMWLKNIYEICGKEITAPYGLKKQVKNKQKHTIRPLGMQKPNPKAVFTDLEDFLHSVYVEYCSLENFTKAEKDAWVNKLVTNYNAFKGTPTISKSKIQF